jgi:hypothetical protein
MQASERFDCEDESGELPLDRFLDYSQIPYYYDDESSEEEIVAIDDSRSVTSIVCCHWYNCRKMFKAGTYLCTDVELFMDHIKRDHINPLQLEGGDRVQCLWGFNRCHEEIAGEDYLKHVEEHFKEDEYTREAYPNPTLAPKQWVYCLWQGCHEMFADRDAGEIWWDHVWWDHMQDEGEEMDVVAKIPCEWKECEGSEEGFEPEAIAEHVQKHLGDAMRYT